MRAEKRTSWKVLKVLSFYKLHEVSAPHALFCPSASSTTSLILSLHIKRCENSHIKVSEIQLLMCSWSFQLVLSNWSKKKKKSPTAFEFCNGPTPHVSSSQLLEALIWAFAVKIMINWFKNPTLNFLSGKLLDKPENTRTTPQHPIAMPGGLVSFPNLLFDPPSLWGRLPISPHMSIKIESCKHVLYSELMEAGVEAQGLSSPQLGVKCLPFESWSTSLNTNFNQGMSFKWKPLQSEVEPVRRSQMSNLSLSQFPVEQL